MKKVNTKDSSKPSRRMRPALTPEARENQMISLAVDLAEKQLIEGTASSQVITHFLKLGTTNAKVELEILKNQSELVKAKTKAIKNAEENAKMYKEALEAMKRYSGGGGNY